MQSLVPVNSPRNTIISAAAAVLLGGVMAYLLLPRIVKQEKQEDEPSASGPVQSANHLESKTNSSSTDEPKRTVSDATWWASDEMRAVWKVGQSKASPKNGFSYRKWLYDPGRKLSEKEKARVALRRNAVEAIANLFARNHVDPSRFQVLRLQRFSRDLGSHPGGSQHRTAIPIYESILQMADRVPGMRQFPRNGYVADKVAMWTQKILAELALISDLRALQLLISAMNNQSPNVRVVAKMHVCYALWREVDVDVDAPEDQRSKQIEALQREVETIGHNAHRLDQLIDWALKQIDDPRAARSGRSALLWGLLVNSYPVPSLVEPMWRIASDSSHRAATRGSAITLMLYCGPPDIAIPKAIGFIESQEPHIAEHSWQRLIAYTKDAGSPIKSRSEKKWMSWWDRRRSSFTEGRGSVLIWRH